MQEETEEQRHAREDWQRLTPAQREVIIRFARFAEMPNRGDADMTNLEALKELVKKRVNIVAILSRAELIELAKRYLLMLGAIAGAIIALMSVYKQIIGGW